MDRSRPSSGCAARTDDQGGDRRRLPGASDRGRTDVSNPNAPDLDHQLLPSAAPTAALECIFFGLNGTTFALSSSRRLNGTQAAVAAEHIRALPLGSRGPRSAQLPERRRPHRNRGVQLYGSRRRRHLGKHLRMPLDRQRAHRLRRLLTHLARSSASCSQAGLTGLASQWLTAIARARRRCRPRPAWWRRACRLRRYSPAAAPSRPQPRAARCWR